MNEALANGIVRVEKFATPDGQEFRTLVEAEYHVSRAAVVKLLADHPDVGIDSAEAAANTLGRDKSSRALVRAWLQNLERVEGLAR